VPPAAVAAATDGRIVEDVRRATGAGRKLMNEGCFIHHVIEFQES
jgi:hypothetical protein